MTKARKHQCVNVFITGMLRSGTTLLDKLLDGLEDSRVLSQPFPFFFREVKRRFYRDISYQGSKYFLNDYFFEEDYSLNQLSRYLRNFEFSREEIFDIFNKMSDYSGKNEDTSFLKPNLNNSSYSFIDLFNTFLYHIEPGKSKSALRGFKEVQCEEFIPAFINNSWKTVIILRNPYDVLTSIQFGKGNQYTGDTRPTLFHLRNWRKSADMAILFSQQNNFHLVKYEDLLLSPNETLKALLIFLGYHLTDKEIEKIITEKLKNWKGNSSFDSNQQIINKNAYGRYKEKMPNDMQQYISKLCEPELKFFGYEVLHESAYEPQNYREPFEIDQEDFVNKKDFSTSTQNLNQEMYRLNLLKESNITYTKLLQSAFIDSFIYNELKKAYHNS